MPNWCGNIVYVTGPKGQLDELERKIDEAGSFIDAVDPVKEWDYHGCIARWGTKWADRIDELMQEGDYLTMRFDTAWAPPDGAIATASQLYQDCTFGIAYYEGGMGFYGYAIFKGGELCLEVDVPFRHNIEEPEGDEGWDTYYDEFNDAEMAHIDVVVGGMVKALDSEAKKG